MRFIKPTLLMAVCLLGIYGCSHAPLQEGYGESTANNKRQQVIDPVAGRVDIPSATIDGQKAEKLLKGYRTDSGVASTSTILDMGK